MKGLLRGIGIFLLGAMSGVYAFAILMVATEAYCDCVISRVIKDAGDMVRNG